jgi:hypothetical protein
MTREDIMHMAREAGFDVELGMLGEESVEVDGIRINEKLERFAALVAAAEREACIRDVRAYGGIHIYDAGKIVEDIRARGSK